MRPRALPGAVFVCALICATAYSQEPSPPAACGGRGQGEGGGPADCLAETTHTTATALAGDHLRLAGGTEVLLAGILAPRGRRDPLKGPLATEARDALADLLANHTVSVRSIAAGPDRAGRLRAHVLRDDGLWLQTELLKRGLARVALTADTADFADDLLAAEHEARAAQRGLWTHKAYALRDAADAARLNDDVGTFQVVAGTVKSTARKGDSLYLDFGDDYRTDVTVTIPREAWPAFRALKPMSLAGHRVEARGWVNRHNGPEIELTVPALLVVLDAEQSGPAKPKRVRRARNKPDAHDPDAD